MRYLLYGLMVVPMVIGASGCRREEKAKADEGPLLLADGPATVKTGSDAAKGPPADNSRCHVCHINYQDEELATQHAAAGVGCANCHGDSSAHCGDEDNITPPEIMIPKGKVNASCMKCHPQLTEQHQPVLAGTTKEKYCTECHGEHRMAYRTRNWDRETGQLVSSDRQ